MLCQPGIDWNLCRGNDVEQNCQLHAAAILTHARCASRVGLRTWQGPKLSGVRTKTKCLARWMAKRKAPDSPAGRAFYCATTRSRYATPLRKVDRKRCAPNPS